MMKDYATVKETYIARYPHSFSASGKGTCSRWKHRIVNYYEWQLDPLITKAHETSFKKQFRTGVIPNLDGYTEMWYEKDLKFDDALSIVTEKLGDSLRSFNG